MGSDSRKNNHFLTINVFIERYEPWLFFLLCLLNLFPLLGGKFFPTLDGAAHLHNSQLLSEMITGRNNFLASYYSFTNELVPNWTGHFILTFFNYFLPAYLAEKILLIIYLLGIPLSFRYLSRQVLKKGSGFALLIFPLSHSFLFYLGFWNFSIAIVTLFLTVGTWIKHYHTNSYIKKFLVFFVLLTATYFSHIFVFASTLIICALYSICDLVISNQFKSRLRTAFTNTILLTIAGLPTLFLFFSYFSNRTEFSTYIFLSKRDLLQWISDLRPLIIYDIQKERSYSHLISAMILFSVIAALVRRGYYYYKQRSINSTILHRSDFLIFSSLFFLLCFFKLPDSDGSAGFVSVRLALLFFICLVLWLSTQPIPISIGVFVSTLALFPAYKLSQYHFQVIRENNLVAESHYEAGKHIPPNSIVMPLNRSGNWLFTHFSNYAGTEKPMVILENYECDNNYFPLTWNKNLMPEIQLANHVSSSFPCAYWHTGNNQPPDQIEYILQTGIKNGEKDECQNKIDSIILQHSLVVFSDSNVVLYKMR